MLNIQRATSLGTSRLSSQSALVVSSFIMRFMTSKCLTFTNIISLPTESLLLASLLVVWPKGGRLHND